MLSTSLFSQLTASSKTDVSKVKDQKLVVDNLLVGINSNNNGLKLSSLYEMGNYDEDKSVLELMRTLKSSKDETARITAALSLYKLKDARGIFAVKRAARFDDSERVRNLCDKFYRQFLSQKNS